MDGFEGLDSVAVAGAERFLEAAEDEDEEDGAEDEVETGLDDFEEGGFELIWMDDDVIQVRVQASNGRFAATANCYCDPDAFARPRIDRP